MFVHVSKLTGVIVNSAHICVIGGMQLLLKYVYQVDGLWSKKTPYSTGKILKVNYK